MATTRTASAHWEGLLMEGAGQVTLESSGIGTYDVTWPSRAEEANGRTSPEELIAAAHSTCFSMALSGALAKGGNAPTTLDTTAEVTFQPGTGITGIVLKVVGDVPGSPPSSSRRRPRAPRAARSARRWPRCRSAWRRASPERWADVAGAGDVSPPGPWAPPGGPAWWSCSCRCWRRARAGAGLAHELLVADRGEVRTGRLALDGESTGLGREQHHVLGRHPEGLPRARTTRELGQSASCSPSKSCGSSSSLRDVRAMSSARSQSRQAISSRTNAPRQFMIRSSIRPTSLVFAAVGSPVNGRTQSRSART